MVNKATQNQHDELINDMYKSLKQNTFANAHEEMNDLADALLKELRGKEDPHEIFQEDVGPSPEMWERRMGEDC